MITGNMTLNALSGYQDEDKRIRQLFDKVLHNAAASKLMALLTGISSQLQSLEKASCGRQASNRHYLGLRTVSNRQIRGSETRTQDFDSSFRPLNDRTFFRWSSVARAHRQGVPLPPVDLIKIGETYFVRDGHHRISVAGAFGEQYIEAEVKEW